MVYSASLMNIILFDISSPGLNSNLFILKLSLSLFMRYTIYVLLFITSTTFGQDSLRRVPVPAWQLSRLIDETKSGRICDSVLRSYIVLTESQRALLSNQDSLLNELTLSRDTWKFTSEQKDTIITNHDLIHKSAIRQEKNTGNKKGLAGIIIGIVIGLLIL